MKAWTAEVLESNRMKAAEEKIAVCRTGGRNPIKHVIYIIKENRTYDQIFGDLKQNGKRGGQWRCEPDDVWRGRLRRISISWRCSLACWITSYDSGEVSGDGHVWSTAAIGTDYLEKTWQQRLSRRRSGRMTLRAWWRRGIRCCRRFRM